METEWVDMLQTVGDLEGIIPWELQWQAKIKVCSKLVVGGAGEGLAMKENSGVDGSDGEGAERGCR